MLAAELKGKLGRAITCCWCHEETDTSSFHGFEDVLTSNVFGTLRYLPPAHGLAPVLRDLGLDASQIADMEFWPNEDGCEPDVVIDFGHSVVVVEAKLNAPFGDDQLPREVAFARRRAAGRPWRLLCVTSHVTEPAHHLFAAGGVPLKGPRAKLADGVTS